MKISASEVNQNNGFSWTDATVRGGSYVFFRTIMNEKVLSIGHFEKGVRAWFISQNEPSYGIGLVSANDSSYRDLRFFPIQEMNVTYSK
jgi:hypothetical protein